MDESSLAHPEHRDRNDENERPRKWRDPVALDTNRVRFDAFFRILYISTYGYMRLSFRIIESRLLKDRDATRTALSHTSKKNDAARSVLNERIKTNIYINNNKEKKNEQNRQNATEFHVTAERLT